MLQAKTTPNALPHNTARDVTLMPDEQVHESLGINKDGESKESNRNIVLLTDRRVIHISGAKSSQKTSFAAIEDISIVELTRQPPRGYGAYIWAGLAFLVSVMLWRIIENQTFSIAAAVIVALMGVYLIIDRLTLQGEHLLLFKSGSAEIQVEIKGDGQLSNADTLITKLFELKEERISLRYSRAKTFSPR